MINKITIAQPHIILWGKKLQKSVSILEKGTVQILLNGNARFYIIFEIQFVKTI